MSEKSTKIGKLACYCLHPKFPELKDTTDMDELEKMFTLDMGVIISEEDKLGYLDVYSQKEGKSLAVHKEFLKVATNG